MPLHRCSIYGNAEAGKRLKAMMEMGASMAEYFAPLKTWLDEQNKGKKIGW